MKTHTLRIATMLGLAVATVLVLAAPAAAQPTGEADNDQVVLTGRLAVPEGETVGTAVIFNGPATIDGTVQESLVVLNGDAVVTGTVARDVIVVNGDVRIASGAEVGGDLVSRGVPDVEQGATVRGDQQRVTGRIDWGEAGIASRLAWWLGYSVSALVLGLLLLAIFPGLDAAVTRVVRGQLGAAFGFGAVTFFAVPIAAGILLVTIVGIPLGLFVLLALALLYTVGYVAGAHAVGRLLVKPPASRFLAFLAGFAILRVAALVPVLGGITWFVATLLGLGVLFVAARAARAGAARGTAEPVPPMPPAPISPEPRP